MSVYSRDPLVASALEEFGSDDFFHGQDNAVSAADADAGAAILDGLDGVLDLEVAAVGGEDGVGEVVACAYGRLDGVVSLV